MGLEALAGHPLDKRARRYAQKRSPAASNLAALHKTMTLLSLLEEIKILSFQDNV